jgi:glycosyltransferase involved in cell wall biosynthesis
LEPKIEDTHRNYSGVPNDVSGFASRQRLLILVVAYMAERTIESVLGRIPRDIANRFDAEVLVIDDGSRDATFAHATRLHASDDSHLLPVTVLRNPVNQGYGGNQKVGIQYAIANGFDFLILLHGDGQYAPECMEHLLEPLVTGSADAVIGSRMLDPGLARSGGMPLYKFAGNRILTKFQNLVLGTRLSEFHSGYRAYSVAALSDVPFSLDTNDFHFDTEILVQFFLWEKRVAEVGIPTYYGDEICYVNGMKYAKDVAIATAKGALQRLGIFYDPKFDVSAHSNEPVYESKLDFESPQNVATSLLCPGARVLDIGCGPGDFSNSLRDRGCYVVGVDGFPQDSSLFDRFILADLDTDPLPANPSEFDTVLMLDILEHLSSPEDFLALLRESIWAGSPPGPAIIASTGNVAFLPLRLSMLLGEFNYGRRGILDLTHKRLFTKRTFLRLVHQAGYVVDGFQGIPPPLPMMLSETPAERILFKVSALLAHRFPSLSLTSFLSGAMSAHSLGGFWLMRSRKRRG